MNTATHTRTCRDYVRNQITENADSDGEISMLDTVLVDSDTVWGVTVGELIDTYLSDGTASCSC